jgi:hypothetical protein
LGGDVVVVGSEVLALEVLLVVGVTVDADKIGTIGTVVAATAGLAGASSKGKLSAITGSPPSDLSLNISKKRDRRGTSAEAAPPTAPDADEEVEVADEDEP